MRVAAQRLAEKPRPDGFQGPNPNATIVGEAHEESRRLLFRLGRQAWRSPPVPGATKRSDVPSLPFGMAAICANATLRAWQVSTYEADIESVRPGPLPKLERRTPGKFLTANTIATIPYTPGSTYNTAIGFPGEPVAPTIGTGAKT